MLHLDHVGGSIGSASGSGHDTVFDDDSDLPSLVSVTVTVTVWEPLAVVPARLVIDGVVSPVLHGPV